MLQPFTATSTNWRDEQIFIKISSIHFLCFYFNWKAAAAKWKKLKLTSEKNKQAVLHRAV